MKKHITAAIMVAGITTVGLVGAGVASAATSSDGTSPMSNLVSAISSKFNLNKTDVQAVFDEQHTKMKADRETEVQAEITQLVKDGKLTQAQADAINAKRAELQKEREANRTAHQNLSDTERRAKMDENRAAMDKWFTDNNISTDYRKFVMGGGRGHGDAGSMRRMQSN